MHLSSTPALSQLKAVSKLRAGVIRPPRLVILGPPAGGKGTQCELLVDLLGVIHLSTGNILRQAIQDQTMLGLKAQQFLDKGELVPDDLITDVVLARIAESDCDTRGWLLDGFPRTVGQAKALLAVKGGSAAPDCILELKVADEEVIRRIAGRRVDLVTGKTYHVEFNPPPAELADRIKQRSDDTEEKIRTRLIQFHSHVDAIRSAFESHYGATVPVMRVNGDQAPLTIARAFADFALQRAAQRSLNLIQFDNFTRFRRRVEASDRQILLSSPQQLPYPIRANVRAFYAPRVVCEQDQQTKHIRRTTRDLLRRLRAI